jgi:uncharacterized membrane protein
VKQWRRTLNILTLTLSFMTVATLVTGCGSDAGAPANGTCTTYSQVTIWPKCITCHSSTITGDNRMDATPEVNFDSYDAAKMQGVLADTWVSAGLMPPAGHPQPTDAEKASLRDWVDCGLPK